MSDDTYREPSMAVSMHFEIPNNCPPDIELMAIWAQSMERYSEELSDIQMNAAVNWFKSYIDERHNKRGLRNTCP